MLLLIPIDLLKRRLLLVVVVFVRRFVADEAVLLRFVDEFSLLFLATLMAMQWKQVVRAE